MELKNLPQAKYVWYDESRDLCVCQECLRPFEGNNNPDVCEFCSVYVCDSHVWVYINLSRGAYFVCDLCLRESKLSPDR